MPLQPHVCKGCAMRATIVESPVESPQKAGDSHHCQIAPLILHSRVEQGTPWK
jgi:hypothetical protein